MTTDLTPVSPAKLARLEAAAQRRRGPVLLADVSGSMDTQDTVGGLRRIDHLAQLMGHLLSRTRLQALIAFETTPVHIPLQGAIQLPRPSGSTHLGLALDDVLRLSPTPTRCIILCDGEVTDRDRAMTNASHLRYQSIPIDAFFVGDDNDLEAQRFLRELVAMGAPGGSYAKHQLGDHYRIAEEIVLRLTHDARR